MKLKVLGFAVALSLVSSGAFAQTALPELKVDRLVVNPSLSGSLLVHDGRLLHGGEVRVGLIGEYARALSITRRLDSGVVAMDRAYSTVGFVYGFTDHLQISAQLPIVLTQGGGLASTYRAPATTAIAPVVVALRGGLNESERFPLSFSIELGGQVPLGDASGLVVSTDNVRPTPFARVNVGKDFGVVRLFAEGNLFENIDTRSALLRSAPADRMSDEVGGGLGLAIPVGPVSLEAAAVVSYDFEFPGTSTEVNVGARWAASKNTTLFLAGGPAFGTLIGTPDWRAFGGLLFSFDKAPAEQKRTPDVAGTPLASTSGGSAPSAKSDLCTKPNADPSACPDADLDSDGIANRADQCVSQGEDVDGYLDADGCPDPDNDGDSVADASDKCPNEAGVLKFAGCPIPDADKDGIADSDDACPKEYGMVASRGCPVKDADGDSFADAKDACPTKAGIVELKGCPATDRDADGVFDHLDNCPRERGLVDNGGCPAKKKQLVLITPDSLELRDKVFFVSKKPRIQPRSNKLIKQIATVLKQAKHIEQVRIEVFGDDDLNADKNRKLTQDRADAVRSALVKAGVAPNRLVAVGRGNEDPIDPKRTFKAKATNRRVELKIVQPETPATM